MPIHPPSPNDRPPLLEVRQLSKRFTGVQALSGVHLAVHPGEVVAVIGENGAGKSTLMKILAGIQTPDAGEVRVDGTRVSFDSVNDALKAGIALIHQELNLCGNLSVAANIFLGREPHRFGLIDRRHLRTASLPLLQRLGLTCSPETPVAQLSIGRQQMIEIAKALSVEARLLIMDEPTSSLTQHEAEQLFQVIVELRHRGVSIVYISHRLAEVERLADRVVVLRDGQNAGELTRQELNHDRMVKLMVGRDLSQFYQRRPHPIGPPLLRVEDLRTPAHPKHPLNFTVHRGEIVGLAGLVGAGRSELLRTLFGIDRALSGTVHLDGVSMLPRDPIAAIRAGLALVPEDRKLQGVLLEMSVRENLSLAALRRDARAGIFRQSRAETDLAAAMIPQLRIKTPNDQQRVLHLSGGNQQKVVLGKWLSLRPRVLLLDEPTRGIDIGAKQEIYLLMEELAEAGVSVLFASSEMAEILGMADRALVMHEGRIAGELAREQLTEESVMHLATGSNSHS